MILCMKYMYCPILVASLTKFCFDFASPHVFFSVTKRVKDAIDNNRKIVLRNCGMWVSGEGMAQSVSWEEKLNHTICKLKFSPQDVLLITGFLTLLLCAVSRSLREKAKPSLLPCFLFKPPY